MIDDKKDLIKPITMVVISSIIIIVLLYRQEINDRNLSCYNLHLIECEDAHQQNLTYLLCSGLTDTYKEEDATSFCRISVYENCSTEVPKECLIQ